MSVACRFSGDGGDALRYTGSGGNWYHNGMRFTTFDSDNCNGWNGAVKYNCAPDRGGGWWYNYCYHACPFCADSCFEWDSLPTDPFLSAVVMKIWAI